MTYKARLPNGKIFTIRFVNELLIRDSCKSMRVCFQIEKPRQCAAMRARTADLSLFL